MDFVDHSQQAQVRTFDSPLAPSFLGLTSLVEEPPAIALGIRHPAHLGEPDRHRTGDDTAKSHPDEGERSIVHGRLSRSATGVGSDSIKDLDVDDTDERASRSGVPGEQRETTIEREGSPERVEHSKTPSRCQGGRPHQVAPVEGYQLDAQDVERLDGGEVLVLGQDAVQERLLAQYFGELDAG